MCSPSQTLIHSIDGRAFLVIDVREGTEDSRGPVLVLGDANLEETGTLEIFKMVYANTPDEGVDYTSSYLGFVGGRFSTARQSVG